MIGYCYIAFYPIQYLSLKELIQINIELKPFRKSDLTDFWQLAFSDDEAEWTKWNGPYFHDKLPTQSDFINHQEKYNYVNNPLKKLIWLNGHMVGMVSANYEDGDLMQWLDVGIVIYDESRWHSGIGKEALRKWISELFEFVDLPHIGLTTWSGNIRMMKLAESIGMTKEAQIRQVRYWNGKYWDSVKYGILREEWLSN